MKKLILLITLFFTINFVKSEEGMLIPTLLGAFESDMQAMGMKLSAQDIFDVNNASIKDAIIHFGGGCTAEIISDKGLILTNHHCGFSQINNHSSLDNNILKNGFWAANHDEELPNKGLTAARMINIKDVTSEVFAGTEGKTENERIGIIQANMARLKAEAEEGTHYEADIKPFDFGNSYYLLVKETFHDVRLVGTPPSTVGKFGGDTDNWVWPRHTGDFSVFRIYTDENNLPAEYNENNKPYSPLYHLPISLKDKKDGDFTMVFGFPGRTEQHTISNELDFIINEIRPAQIRMRDLSLSVINAGMRKSEETTLQYASKQARIANAWKKWIGQIDGLKRADAVNVKKEYEKKYETTAATKEEWSDDYKQVVNALNQLAKNYQDVNFAYNIYNEYYYVGAEFFKQVRNIQGLLDECDQGDEDAVKGIIDELIKGAEGFYKNYDPSIDKEIFKLQSQYYSEIIPDKFLAPSLKNNKIEELANELFNKSIFTDKDKYISFLEKFKKSSPKKIYKDPAYMLGKELTDIFESHLLNDLRIYFGQKNTLMKQYVKGKLEMFPEDKHWADANSTLRVTYGKLEGSIPRDGMKYTPYTTFKGIIEKYNTGEEDFDLLPRMLELYDKKDYRDYDQDGELWICFTGSNHTTGGNSGSPVIDAEGNLMGINFDRSWESTMSDYMFDASRCRNISVDIRYVLWMIEVYGEAGHIIEELTLVKD